MVATCVILSTRSRLPCRLVPFIIIVLSCSCCVKIHAFLPTTTRRLPKQNHPYFDIYSSLNLSSYYNMKNDGEEKQSDFEQPTEEQYLRFGGVGRLYTNPNELQNQKDNNESETSTSSSYSASFKHCVQRLLQSTVIVVGLGGVGSWAAEALCRSGVGNLILIDLDDICISNTNRQLHATCTTIGKMKIDEMKRRLLDINPHCNITCIHDFISTDNVHDILSQCTLSTTATSTKTIICCLDAIDGSQAKSALLAACTELQIPIVTSGGAAGRIDPTKITCQDLTQVGGDTLLKSCRYILRKQYGFEQGVNRRRGQTKKQQQQVQPQVWNIPAVYSTEKSKTIDNNDNDVSSLRRCDGALGTACFVTGTFGFVAAGRVIDMIATNQLIPPRKQQQKENQQQQQLVNVLNETTTVV